MDVLTKTVIQNLDNLLNEYKNFFELEFSDSINSIRSIIGNSDQISDIQILSESDIGILLLDLNKIEFLLKESNLQINLILKIKKIKLSLNFLR